MALAVVVRTFMLSHAGRHSSEGFDFCDTTHCQLYRGEQDLTDRVASPAVSNAVVRTAGQILTFEGHPTEGYYTAACGGLSATPSMVWGGSSRYPYSRIVCRWCRPSRFSRWERAADASHILDSLSAVLASKLSPATELITNRDQRSGFVRSVTLRDGTRQVLLSTDAFRRAIGLRLGWNTVLSPTFTVERRGSRFIFRGRGFGSQVGLCEEGAVAQAVAGRGYRDILRFYYPGAEISE
jgi:stage II sporulation protein D